MKPNELATDHYTVWKKADLLENNLLRFLLLNYYPYREIFLTLQIVSKAGTRLNLRNKMPVGENKAIMMISDKQDGLDDS